MSEENKKPLSGKEVDMEVRRLFEMLKETGSGDTNTLKGIEKKIAILKEMQTFLPGIARKNR